MGLTVPEPAPLVVTCNGHSIELSDEQAEWYSTDWKGTVDHSPHGSCATKLAGLLRDARQDPQPASTVEIGGQVMTQAQYDAARFPLLHQDPEPAVEPDTTSDTLDFDAMPVGTVAEVTLLDGDRLLALKQDNEPGRNWYIGDSSEVDITKLRDVRVVYQPAPVSPYEGLRAVLAGRDDADELIAQIAERWDSTLSPAMQAVGDAARSGGAT